MNGTEHFKEVIAAYLDQQAAEDAHFAERRDRIARPIGDVITYILNQVKASGCNGFSDDEIFGMALHCAEDEVEIGQPIPCQVVINRQIQLTEDEMAEAKRKAQEQLIREEMNRQRRSSTPKKPQAVAQEETTLSLFD
ncbi:MAG: PcfK-like family protein [Bacteroidales bacterium]|nr:PcfK-like family protein [Bacteroidales bacterium]